VQEQQKYKQLVVYERTILESSQITTTLRNLFNMAKIGAGELMKKVINMNFLQNCIVFMTIVIETIQFCNLSITERMGSQAIIFLVYG
jgi:hypothetical protein